MSKSIFAGMNERNDLAGNVLFQTIYSVVCFDFIHSFLKVVARKVFWMVLWRL